MKQSEYEVLFEDDYFVAVNKPGGVTVQPDKTNKRGLIQHLKQQMGCELFVVHRLDRPVSGVLLFAKKKFPLVQMNKQFQEHKVVKKYWAVVANKPKKTQDTLIHYMRKDQENNRSFAFNKPLHNTKKAELDFSFLSSIERYHLLAINLKTGRHHQIRSQLSAIESPIKGDVKYGARRGNKDRTIHLHAFHLAFKHPDTGKKVIIQAPPPDESVWNAFNIVEPFDF